MENIGKKVYEFIESGNDYRLDKSKVYTIKEEIDTDKWPSKFVVTDEDGNEKTIDSNMVLYVPNTELSEEEMILKYLCDNEVYPSEVYKENNEIVVLIEWGDWKHEHGWCESAMGYIGYNEIGEYVTEENGSDCYSSEHYFIKK